MANPAMDKNGEELIGGVIGYMKSLAKIVHDHRPKKIVVVWESGGSPRRRRLYPEYKQNRKPARMNRFYDDIIPDTDENKDYQIRAIITLLRSLPVYQLYVENCEADDVIGYLCKLYRDETKIIVSSDKDYYQLLNENTKVFRPGKKTFVKEKDVIEEYDIHPRNFCVAKAFCGDNSDNVPGVPRVGFKTLAKKFTLNDKEVSIDDIVKESKSHVEKDKKPLKLYKNIVENEELIKRNMEIMVLDDRLLDINQVNEINRMMKEFKPKWNKIKLWQDYLKLELDGLDIDALSSVFLYLRNISK